MARLKIKTVVSAEVLNNYLTIDEMQQLIAQANDLGYTSLDRIHVDYHKGDYRDPRDRDWMTLSIRKAP